MPGPGRQPRGMKAQVKNPGELFLRLMKYVLKDYKFHCISVVVLIVVSVLCNVQGTMFMKNLIDEYITPFLLSDNPNFTPLAHAIARVAAFYALGVLATFGYNRLMVNVTQGTLRNLRNDLFSHMEKLPVKYFDTHAHGDIMSVYTNDIDTLRQMISQSMPQLLNSGITIISVFVSMLILSIPLTVVTMIMVGIMVFCSKKSAGQSGAYFAKQQKDLGTVNGYIEEMMNGQKVVKVFCHEDVAAEEFELLNRDLRDNQIRAQFFGGIMGPVMGNLSQVNYALTACIGGLLCVFRGFDVGGLSVFLNFSRQFSRPINEISMQVSNVFSALAGAERVFTVMDEAPETEDDKDAVTLAPMEGHVILDHVTFGYNPDKVILNDISLYAKPGQKIAFVGSTGAGKTTITNLINRFYDIQSGSITIDGVDIRHIKRENLRSNIAMVLQDTWLFHGTIYENIAYGKPDATLEDVQRVCKAARIHNYIMRLPKQYDTVLTDDGRNISKGQKTPRFDGIS